MNDIQMDSMEGKMFEVGLAAPNGGTKGVDTWASNDAEKFSWGVGPAGDLMIFRSRYHAAFSARLEKDVRWYVYAPGTWLNVEVLDDVVEEDGVFEGVGVLSEVSRIVEE